MLCLFVLFSTHSLKGDSIEFNSTAPLVISEDAPIGSIVGNFIPKGNSMGNELSFEIVPSLPTGLTPSLWLDASELPKAGKQWDDRSPAQNHAIRKGSAFGYPFIKTRHLNGLSVMHYCGGKGVFHEFPRLTDIRTVFWVINYQGAYSFLLGDKQSHHFHSRGEETYFYEQHIPQGIREARFSLNGTIVDGKNTPQPHEPVILSLRTTTPVTASNFTNDRNIDGRYFKGDLGELIIFNHPLSDNEIYSVEATFPANGTLHFLTLCRRANFQSTLKVISQ